MLLYQSGRDFLFLGGDCISFSSSSDEGVCFVSFEGVPILDTGVPCFVGVLFLEGVFLVGVCFFFEGDFFGDNNFIGVF